jgi:hypothetical protein
MENEAAVEQGTIYVCHLSELITCDEFPDNSVFVCIRDTEADIPAVTGKAVVLFYRGKTTMIDLLFRIQNIFSSAEHWYYSMVQCIMEKNLQKLLDCCTGILGNSIVISDSNYALIAYTANPENDDEVLGELIHTGTFGRETIDIFLHSNARLHWKEQQEIKFQARSRFSRHPLAHATVMVDEQYFFRITMLGSTFFTAPKPSVWIISRSTDVFAHSSSSSC